MAAQGAGPLALEILRGYFDNQKMKAIKADELDHQLNPAME